MVLRMVGKVLYVTVVLFIYLVLAVALLKFWQPHWYLAVFLEVVWLGVYIAWVYVLFLISVFPRR